MYLEQRIDICEYMELTHLMLELWVLQAHHLQQNRDNRNEAPTYNTCSE